MDNVAAAAQSPQPLEQFDMKGASEDEGANAAGPSAVSSPTKRPPPYVVRMPNSHFSIAHNTSTVALFSSEVGWIVHGFEYQHEWYVITA